MPNSPSASLSYTSARTAPVTLSDFIDDAVYAADRRNAGLDRVTEPDCWTGTCGHASGAECLASMRPALATHASWTGVSSHAGADQASCPLCVQGLAYEAKIAERRVAAVFAVSAAADAFAAF